MTYFKKLILLLRFQDEPTMNSISVLIALVLMFFAACTSEASRNSLARDSSDAPILYLGPTGVAGIHVDGRPTSLSLPRAGPMPTWSPNGEQLAYVTVDEKTAKQVIRVMGRDGSAKTVFSVDEGLTPTLSWSPNSHWLASFLIEPLSVAIIDVKRKTIASRIDLSGSVRTWGTEHMGLGPEKFRWSPDSGKILVAGGTPPIVIHTGTRAITRVTDVPSLAEWAGSGEAVYYFEGSSLAGPAGHFYLRTFGSAAPIKLADRKSYRTSFGFSGEVNVGVWAMSLAPRSSKLAMLMSSGVNDGQTSVIAIYNLGQGRNIDLSKPLKRFQVDSMVTQLQWAPDESSLVAAVAPNRENAIYIKLLELGTGTWRTLSRVAIPSGERGLGLAMPYTFGRAIRWTE